MATSLRIPALLAQDAHQHDVDVSSVHVDGLAEGALPNESGLFVAADRPLVGGEDLQSDTVQVEIVEGEAHEQAHRFGAIPVPALLGVTEADLQIRGPVHGVYPPQLTGPDELVAFDPSDRE